MSTKIFGQVEREMAQRLFDAVRDLSSEPFHPGVTRPSYSVTESRALYEIKRAADFFDLDAIEDGAANLHVIDGESDADEIAEPTAWHPGAIWIGSHIDSVPNGGNYDGLAGIVAGLLVIWKIRDRRVYEGVRVKRPVRLVAMRGEESAWFGIPHIGAKAILGKLSSDDLGRCDSNGVSLRDRMEVVGVRFGDAIGMIHQQRPLVKPSDIAEFWELHIEQGPVLVNAGHPTAIVSDIRGNMRASTVRIKGQAGHSGTTPRELRHDAVFAFAEFICALDTAWSNAVDRKCDLVVTCGRVKTNDPCNLTRIPDDVEFCLEWRSRSPDMLLMFASIVDRVSENIGRRRGVEFDFGNVVTTAPAKLDETLAARAMTANEALTGLRALMPSGAGHDAAVFAQAGVPTGMIFVRNANGSHNPEEAMDMDDFMIGVELLYKTVTE